MANVGTGSSGKTLIGAGVGSSPTYADIGTNSGLTDHGIIVGGGLGAFEAIGTGIAGQLLTSNGAGSNPSFQSGGSSFGQTITGDSGGALIPTAGDWNILGSGSTTTSGSGSTLTAQLTGLTNHAVLVGAGTSTITKLAVGATGELLIGVTGADPAFGSSANANFTFGGANSGATRTFSITNTSDAASSQANEVISVGGSLAGDAFTTYTVTGAQSFSQGIDNSDSDLFVLSSSTALGTNNLRTIDANGQVVFTSLGTGVNHQFKLITAISAETRWLLVTNSSDTASSQALVQAAVAGSTAGDAYYVANISSGQSWAWGLDNSDSDAFVLSSAATLGTTNTMRVSVAGEVNLPLQPSFSATNNGALSNVTGDGTNYTIIFGTEDYDIGGSYNAGTGVFTAPIAGKYQFNTSVSLSEIGAAHTSCIIQIVTSGGTAEIIRINPIVVAVSGIVSFSGAIQIDLTAAQTASVLVVVSGSTKTVDIPAAIASRFSGSLLS